MSSFFSKLSSESALRLGLGAMYLYSGVDLFRHPSAWYWAVRPIPEFVKSVLINPVGLDNFLKLQGIGEIIFAIVLLVWFLPRWILKFVAGLSVLEMAAILLMTGVDSITFRDIGLLGASLALLIEAIKTPENQSLS